MDGENHFFDVMSARKFQDKTSLNPFRARIYTFNIYFKTYLAIQSSRKGALFFEKGAFSDKYILRTQNAFCRLCLKDVFVYV